MKIYKSIISLILLTSISCQGNHMKPEGEASSTQNIRLDHVQDISNPGEHFAKTVYQTDWAKTSFAPSQLDQLNYHQLFKEDGITQIVAYHDKSISQPTTFQDFLLFVVSYDKPDHANSAFERIQSDAALSTSNHQATSDQNQGERIELLQLGDRYGGLITYHGNQVYSLVEDCDKLPMGKEWLELEYMLTDLLRNEKGYVDVLKAGCAEGRYYGGRRKAG